MDAFVFERFSKIHENKWLMFLPFLLLSQTLENFKSVSALNTTVFSVSHLLVLTRHTVIRMNFYFWLLTPLTDIFATILLFPI